MFSGLYKLAHGELRILFMTCSDISFCQLGPQHERQNTYTGLQIHQDSAGYIVLIIGLVEEHVFTIATLRRPFLEDALFVDAMFSTQALPVNGAHCTQYYENRIVQVHRYLRTLVSTLSKL